MGAILIKSGEKQKILSELAQQLDGFLWYLDEDQYEVIVLGISRDIVQTREQVSREEIMEKFSGK